MDIDVKDLTSRYTNDVIASCAFGLKVDSFTDKNNQFYVMGETAVNFSFRQLVIFFVLNFLPKLAQVSIFKVSYSYNGVCILLFMNLINILVN